MKRGSALNNIFLCCLVIFCFIISVFIYCSIMEVVSIVLSSSISFGLLLVTSVFVTFFTDVSSVTLSSSLNEVSPSLTLLSPSCQSVFIPLFMASCCTTLERSRLTIICLILSLTISSSEIAILPLYPVLLHSMQPFGRYNGLSLYLNQALPLTLYQGCTPPCIHRAFLPVFVPALQ